MFVLFEDKPDLRIGKVLSTSPGHLQVQSLHGKQQKIKDKMVFLSWEGEPAEAEGMLTQAQELAKAFDPTFMWEATPEAEFSFVDFAKEYFGKTASMTEQTALLIFLRAQPIFFRRGQGAQFRKAPKEQVEAALAGAERRKAQDEIVAQLVRTLMAAQLPDGWSETWPKILVEKQSQPTLEQKALAQAAHEQGCAVELVLQKCGAFADWDEFHLQQFLYTDFPDAAKLDDTLTESALQQALQDIPVNTINGAVFSIDDVSTDEIDDALSVEERDGGYWLGIHIAAPALMWTGRDAAINHAVKRFAARLSTVYHPNGKIPMMGDRHGKSWVDAFSLDAERVVPVVSLMVHLDSAMEPIAHETVVQRLKINHNLRLQDIEADFNQAALQAKTQSGGVNPAAMVLPNDFPEARALDRLWQFACKRERHRLEQGAAQSHHDTEYRITVDQGVVHINKRPRGSPMDELVAELMIYANAYWSNTLKQAQVPAVYRVKDEGKVGFTTTPGRHTTMGLPCYGWFTSPLRRMVDFCNQHQLINLTLKRPPLLRNWRVGEDAPAELAPPWDTVNLESLAFRANTLHGLYRTFQDKMERYWCLRWLQQESKRRESQGEVAHFTVVVQRQMRYPNLLFVDLPLTAKLVPDAMDKLLAGQESEINVKITHVDLWGLNVSLARV